MADSAVGADRVDAGDVDAGVAVWELDGTAGAGVAVVEEPVDAP
jgi:hypothetical protein